MSQKFEKSREPKRGRQLRRKHGTAVAVEIVCAQCGRTDTLAYMPKGIKLSEAMCAECMQRAAPSDSEWKKIEREREEAKSKDWEFLCADCGAKDYLPFEPKPDRTYQCQRCLHDHQEPDKSRLDVKEEVDAHVFVRRAPKTPPGDES